jgi:hypothetical protein
LEYPKTDYILIDARTGITELGRLAIGEYSDTVVCLLLRNPENRAGAGGIIRGLLAKDTPKRVVPILSRLPRLSCAEEERILSEEEVEIVGSGEDVPFHMLHADALLSHGEQVLFSGRATLLESILLYDYLSLFRNLEPELFTASRYDSLTRLLPRRADLDDWGFWSLGERMKELGHEATPIVRTALERRRSVARKRGEAESLVFVPSIFVPGGVHFNNVGLSVARTLSRRMDTEKVVEKTEADVNFDLLALQMGEGLFDFCGEGYFLTTSRMQYAGVVQFGWLPSFECLVKSGTFMHDYVYTHHPEEDLPSTLDALFSSDNCRELEVGMLTETAATSAATPYVAAYVWGDKLLTATNHRALAKWLTERPEKRMVFCDHGVARKIREAIGSSASEYGSGPHGAERLFDFRQQDGTSHRIPVGFLYPQDDLDWRQEISRALADTVKTLGREGWNEVREELSSIRVDTFSYDDLCSYLAMDMTIEEAINWERSCSMRKDQKGDAQK